MLYPLTSVSVPIKNFTSRRKATHVKMKPVCIEQCLFVICTVLCVVEFSNGFKLKLNSTYQSPQIQITELAEQTLLFNYTFSRFAPVNRSFFMRVCGKAEETDIAEAHVSMTQTVEVIREQDEGHFNITVKGLFVGRTHIFLYFVFTSSEDFSSCDIDVSGVIQADNMARLNLTGAYPEGPHKKAVGAKYSVAVVREERAIDVAFNVIVVLLVLVVNLGMGCKTELSVVKEVLRRPVGPITGLCSQFIIMPLVKLEMKIS